MAVRTCTVFCEDSDGHLVDFVAILSFLGRGRNPSHRRGQHRRWEVVSAAGVGTAATFGLICQCPHGRCHCREHGNRDPRTASLAIAASFVAAVIAIGLVFGKVSEGAATKIIIGCVGGE